MNAIHFIIAYTEPQGNQVVTVHRERGSRTYFNPHHLQSLAWVASNAVRKNQYTLRPFFGHAIGWALDRNSSND